MSKKLKSDLWLLAVTSLIGLFLAACGPNGTGASGPLAGSSQTAATPAPTAPPPTPAPSMAMASKPATTGKETTAAPNQVVVEEFTFKPAVLTVKPGTTVTWLNHDDVPHTVVDHDERFKSGALDTDGKFSFTFKTPGTYNYFCTLHPRMTGQIIVK